MLDVAAFATWLPLTMAFFAARSAPCVGEARSDALLVEPGACCCTACAVRVLSGELDQREALGLSHDLRRQGYGLLCVARAYGPVTVETQDEDEVYMLQFGNAFGQGTVRSAIPLEEE